MEKTTASACLSVLVLALSTSPLHAAPPIKISADQRQQLQLTLYNQDLGLVREQRNIPQLSANQQLIIEDVSARLQANTLQVRNAGAILEQNHNTDLLSYQRLLEHYQGKTVTLVRSNSDGDSQEQVRLLTVNSQHALIEHNGQIETIPLNKQWRFAFPAVPNELSLQPSISVRSGGTNAATTAELAYLTGGLNWKMDYVLTLDSSSQIGSLSGMATLINTTGSQFKQAEVSLLAGSVNQPANYQIRAKGARMLADGVQELAMAAAPQRESLQDFYLYRLPNKIDLHNNQQKQVNLLSADNINLTPEYQLSLAAYPHPQLEQRQLKPTLKLVFNNSAKNQLGEPMPAGSVRVFSPDSKQQLQYVGGSNIGHIAQDDEATIQLGRAFDISVNQQQTKLEKTHNGHTLGQKIQVRNSSNKEAKLRLNVNFSQRWEIKQKSADFVRKGRSAEWLLTIPANGSQSLTFEAKLFKQ